MGPRNGKKGNKGFKTPRSPKREPDEGRMGGTWDEIWKK